MVDSVNASGPVQGVAALRPASTKAAPQAAHQRTLADVQSLVRQAAAIADQGPPVDYVKLAQIRAAIFRGDYPINTRAIADAIAMQAHL
ncbi:MAG: flagellar biosynthesis anti-sigma factor FlgM [Chakrabartia sp.]